MVDTSYILRAEFIPKNSFSVKDIAKELDSLNKYKLENIILLNPKRKSIEFVKKYIKGEKLSKVDM